MGALRRANEKRGRSAEILPCGVDKTGFRCKYSVFSPHRKQAKIKKSERVRISAHFLRGDVKFFPFAPAVGASPSTRRGEQNAGAFLGKVGFSRKSGGEKRKTTGFSHGLGRRAHGLGEMARRGGRRSGALAGWGAPRGDERERRSGREWVHRGRKGAQGAAVQEIMRIFVAD